MVWPVIRSFGQYVTDYFAEFGARRVKPGKSCGNEARLIPSDVGGSCGTTAGRKAGVFRQ